MTVAADEDFAPPVEGGRQTGRRYARSRAEADETGLPMRPSGGARRTASGGTRRPATPKVDLKGQIEFLYKMGGGVVIQRGMQHTGSAVIMQAPACAKAWDDFLNQWPQFREALEKAVAMGGIAGLVAAHLPILMAAREELAARQQIEGAGGIPPTT